MIPSLVLTRLLHSTDSTISKSKKTKTKKSAVKVSESEPVYRSEADGEKEPTIEEKVKQLQVSEWGSDKNPQSKSGGVQLSLSQLVTQALQSNDNQLFEKALNSKNDKKIINATISRISPTLVLPLLDSLTNLLLTNPGRAQVLVGWIKSTLLFHSSYLLSVTLQTNF